MPQIGEVIFKSGDWVEPVTEFIVTERNIREIRRFWNKIYFRNREAAEKKNKRIRRFYYKNYKQYRVMMESDYAK